MTPETAYEETEAIIKRGLTQETWRQGWAQIISLLPEKLTRKDDSHDAEIALLATAAGLLVRHRNDAPDLVIPLELEKFNTFLLRHDLLR